MMVLLCSSQSEVIPTSSTSFHATKLTFQGEREKGRREEREKEGKIKKGEDIEREGGKVKEKERKRGAGRKERGREKNV